MSYVVRCGLEFLVKCRELKFVKVTKLTTIIRRDP